MDLSYEEVTIMSVLSIGVTLFSSIFSMILSWNNMIGSDKNLEDGNGDEYEEPHDAIGDAIFFEALELPSPFSHSIETELFNMGNRFWLHTGSFCILNT